MESNPFWTSRTIWVNGVSVIAAILGAAGIASIGAEVQAETVAVIMGVINIVLRFMTDKPVG